MRFRYVIPTFILAIASTNVQAVTWGERGYEDGKTGQQIRYPTDTDMNAYMQGYKQGLSEFCQVDTAKILGKKGMNYQGVCDNHSNRDAFQAAYKKGLERYNQEKWLKLAKRSWY